MLDPALESSSSPKLTMSQAQFARLAAIVHERAGIHFPDTKKYVLESRLARRLTELDIDNYDQYITYLTMGPYQHDEFQEMINKITINETSFFRNEPQLDVFEKQILPELLEAGRIQQATPHLVRRLLMGEEPYTLAIILHRVLGLHLSDWNIEILGTDISDLVLNVARTGKYTDYALRTTPAIVKQRYFKHDEGDSFWKLDPAILWMVNFETHNLKDRYGAKRFGTFDIIFCRNALIYFDERMKTQAVSSFAERLNPDGLLFIGHSESLRGLNVPFESTGSAQGFCYRRVCVDPPAAAKAA